MSEPSSAAAGSRRRVVVTGTAEPSRAVAAGLAAAGATVGVLGPGAADVPGLGKECRFSSAEEIAAALGDLIGELGGIDQLVHGWLAPGLLEPVAFADLDEATWAERCETTLSGGWWLAQQSFPYLRGAGRPSMVVLVPSVGMSGAANYAMLATVAEGLRVMAKSCGRCWGEHGITVNAVATAPEHWLSDASGEALLREIALAVPALGGSGDPAADIAPLVGLLAGADAHFLTASTLVADGGVWMGL